MPKRKTAREILEEENSNIKEMDNNDESIFGDDINDYYDSSPENNTSNNTTEEAVVFDDDDEEKYSISKVEILSRNLIRSVFPQVSTAEYFTREMIGLDIMGKIFSEKSWVKEAEEKFQITSKDLRTNLLFQSLPDLAYLFTRTFLADNRYANLGAASLSTIIPIVNNILNSRGPLNYGTGSNVDILSLLFTLLPVGIEFFRPSLESKFGDKETISKTMDLVSNISGGGNNNSKRIVSNRY